MVDFVIHVPEDTPPTDPVYLTGDGDALGCWRPDAVRLERWGDGTYRTRIQLPHGQPVRYLITRGSWRGVENDGHGGERVAREFHVHGPLTLDVLVRGWGRDAVKYYPDFRSEHLVHSRQISVYLPPQYDWNPERRYSVLYMHDGQNLFDAATAFAGNPWECDDVADRVIRAGECEPFLIVGVGNTPDRLSEYGHRSNPEEQGPDLAQRYGRFLVEELKPFIDHTFRTRREPQATGVAGSSMGGLISLQLCEWYPEVFGQCAAMSPSIWWDRENFLRRLSNNPHWLKTARIWLDMGGQEGASQSGISANLRRTRQLAREFRDHGLIEGVQFQYVEVPEGRHNERDWAARFDDVLRFLFPAHRQ